MTASIARGLAWTYILDAKFDKARELVTQMLETLCENGDDKRLTDTYFGALYLRNGVYFYSDDFDASFDATKETYELKPLGEVAPILEAGGLRRAFVTIVGADDVSRGFDNQAGTLSLSPALLEAYLGAAGKIGRLALGRVEAPTQAMYRIAPDTTQNYHVEGLPFGPRGGVLIEHTFPVDAEYNLKVYSVNLGNMGNFRPFGEMRGEHGKLSPEGRDRFASSCSRLLGADHAHRHDRRASAHSGLDEAAAAEATQLVAVLVELLRALATLGEDEHELALVGQQSLDVGGVGGHPAELRDQHREARVALEEVLDGEVERSRVRVLLADRLGDDRSIRREGTGMVGDEQRPAAGRDVLDPLDLGPEPVAVEELDQGAVEDALDPLRAAPVVELALGLDPAVFGARRVADQQMRAWGELANAYRVAEDLCSIPSPSTSHRTGMPQ